MQPPEEIQTLKASNEHANYGLTRWLYFRCLGGVHFMAFASYSVQMLGLNGSRGILPTANLLAQGAQQLGIERYLFMPTIAWLNCSDPFLQFITYAGIFFSVLMFFGIATGPSLLALTVLWLSIITGGGEFTEFQSDGMLVEASLLSLFFVNWQFFEPPWPVAERLKQQRDPSKMSLWLLRFMIFRIMFASGLVKLLSGDPAWQNLTALRYHYETQPLPTPLAWYAHQLPEWFQKLSVIGLYVSEILAPLLIFFGRRPRIVAAMLMSSLHVFIMLTGNYTFLNYLMITLCIPLLDDGVLRRLTPKSLFAAIQGAQVACQSPRWLCLSVNAASACLLVLAGSQLAATIFGEQYMPAFMDRVFIATAPLHIADRYGLFAVMTTKRPEIIFQGSEDGKTWISYEFVYKPGNDLTRPPPWVAPHMPRLDWRLWFAAMKPAQSSPWILGLVRRLLEGSPDVNHFFVRNPFPGSPPKYICAFTCNYHFTNAAKRKRTGKWWGRSNPQQFLAPVSLKDTDDPDRL